MKFDLKNCNKLILSDKYNDVVFSTLRDIEVYIVGGYLRDVILGKNVIDRDYIVKGDLKKIASQVALKSEGKLIKVGSRNFYRVLLRNGTIMDFNSIDGDIKEDLAKRDFTINALAWSPRTGLIDLYGGVQDIKKGLLTVIKEENLSNDPVRIIRAYRISGETSFLISESTQKILKKLGHKIVQAKTERITLEFFRILNLRDPRIPLEMMLNHSILTYIISIPNSELLARLKELKEINKIISERPFKNLLQLRDTFSQSLSHKGLLRLEILLKGLPVNSLSLSSKIKKRIIDIDKASTMIRNMNIGNSEVLYDAFRIVGDASLDFLIINKLLHKLPDLIRFKKLYKKALLSAQEIINIIGSDEGILIGKAKEFTRKAEFTKEIRTKREAIEALKRRFIDSAI